MNAYKKYLSTRPAASVDSNKRVKHIRFNAVGELDDFFKKNSSDLDEKLERKYDIKQELLSKMRGYRPSGVSSVILDNFEHCMNVLIIKKKPNKITENHIRTEF